MENNTPFADYPGVVTMPGRVGGKPTLGESRVPAALVADCLDHGETAEEVAENYDLKLTDVLKFKAFRAAHQPAIKPRGFFSTRTRRNR